MKNCNVETEGTDRDIHTEADLSRPVLDQAIDKPRDIELGQAAGSEAGGQKRLQVQRIRRNSGKLYAYEGEKEYSQYDTDTAVMAICFLGFALLALYLLNKAGQTLFLLPFESRKEI